MKGFSKGFEKVAAPKWLHEMHKTMNPLKSLRNQSRVGLKNIRLARGVRK